MIHNGVDRLHTPRSGRADPRRAAIAVFREGALNCAQSVASVELRSPADDACPIHDVDLADMTLRERYEALPRA